MPTNHLVIILFFSLTVLAKDPAAPPVPQGQQHPVPPASKAPAAPAKEAPPAEKPTLVVFWSQRGGTKAVAEKIAKWKKADIREIKTVSDLGGIWGTIKTSKVSGQKKKSDHSCQLRGKKCDRWQS